MFVDAIHLGKRAVVVQWFARSLITRPAASISRCTNLALYIRDCVSLCLSDDTLKAVGPFYLVSMPGEVNIPQSALEICVTCRVLHILPSVGQLSKPLMCLPKDGMFGVYITKN